MTSVLILTTKLSTKKIGMTKHVWIVEQDNVTMKAHWVYLFKYWWVSVSSVNKYKSYSFDAIRVHHEHDESCLLSDMWWFSTDRLGLFCSKLVTNTDWHYEMNFLCNLTRVSLFVVVVVQCSLVLPCRFSSPMKKLVRNFFPFTK